ncbi:MAG: hypothetical protein HY654_00825 [Acidobacteria bacterium]|nr:hypothetical protein [Acidobacteriota bacterium]
MTYALAIGVVVMTVQAWLLWRLSRQMGEAARVGTRMTTLGEALSLLTETSEAGFAALAKELNRIADERRPGPPPRAPQRDGTGRRSSKHVSRHGRNNDAVTSRLIAATRRGKSLQEVAAAERVSEGEARLRLTLAEEMQKLGAGARS